MICGYWDCEAIKVDADVYGLISGRHAMPVDEYVFTEVEDMFNFGELERVAMNSIVKTSDTLVLYVTGLTVATVSVINVAKELLVNIKEDDYLSIKQVLYVMKADMGIYRL